MGNQNGKTPSGDVETQSEDMSLRQPTSLPHPSSYRPPPPRGDETDTLAYSHQAVGLLGTDVDPPTHPLIPSPSLPTKQLCHSPLPSHPMDSNPNPPVPSAMSRALTVSDLPALMSVLGNAAHYTYTLGTQLGLDPHLIRTFEQQTAGQPAKYLSLVLEKRLRSSPLTLQALHDTISETPINDEDLAWRLQQSFLSKAQGQSESWTKNLKEKFQSLVGFALDVANLHESDYYNTFHQKLLHQTEFEYIVDLEKSSNFNEMWECLGNYWSYFNYDLLDRVVQQFDNNCLISELSLRIKIYVSELDDFEKATKLCDFVKEFPRQNRIPHKSLKEFKVKISWPEWPFCTLGQVEELKSALTSELAIPKLLLIFSQACTVDDCICLTWLVGSSAATRMGEALLNIPCDFFSKHGITKVTLESEKHIYYTASLEPFADDLRMTYETQVPEFHAQQWPPPPTHEVFNLAMLQGSDTIQQKQPSEERMRFVVEGNVRSVVKGTTTVQLDNLLTLKCFKGNALRRNLVLIEGAPGAGKSTLAWHICKRWKDREIFREIQIVFYIQLRDPEVQSAKSLEEILPEEIGNDMLIHIKACYGKRVLFVLDGWDEFEPGLQEGSLFHKLICKPYKLCLTYSTLLITSRPIASLELQHYASSRVEILGFLPGEISRFFEEALEDPKAVRNLHAQLKERPVIEASCYLPLNAAIVAHIFKELNYNLPDTLHGVFSVVVCGCIRRYMKKQSGEEVEIPSLDEIPLAVQEEFHSLCNLAYEGTMVNKVTFSGQDMDSHGLSAKQNALDLIQVVQSFASRNSKLCHFLHLSVQELLTAQKICKLSPSNQVQTFNQMFNNPRFAAVFRYYAALTELKTEGIKDIIARIAQSRDQQPLLNLMNCLYEAQSASLCWFVASQLNEQLDLNQVTLSPLNWLSVGYFLSCLIHQHPSGSFTVKLINALIDSDNVRFFAKGLSNCDYGSLSVEHPSPCVVLKPAKDALKYLFEALFTNMSIVRLQLDHCHLQMTEDYFPMLLELLSKKCSLQIDLLNLAGNPFGINGLQYFAKELQHNTGLERLSLAGCSLKVTEYNGPLLEEMLRENKSLRELDLEANSIGDKGLGYIARGLNHNTGVVKVSLQECTLTVTEDNGPCLETMLTVNKSLRELDLGLNSIGADGLGYIAKGLIHNSTLVRLSLQCCSLKVTEDNGPLLEEMLSVNKSLRDLNLSMNFIGAIGLRYIAKGLRHNSQVVKLSLALSSLEATTENVPFLAEMLRKNSTLKELDLSANRMLAINGLPSLGEALRDNRGLRSLNLGGLPCVSDEAWKQFVLCLKDNHLTQLNVNMCTLLVLNQQVEVVKETRRQKDLPPLEIISKLT